jgi:hypothetical protein
LHQDALDFLAGQSILETVSQEDDQGKAFTGLVRTGGWFRSLVRLIRIRRRL